MTLSARYLEMIQDETFPRRNKRKEVTPFRSPTEGNILLAVHWLAPSQTFDNNSIINNSSHNNPTKSDHHQILFSSSSFNHHPFIPSSDITSVPVFKRRKTIPEQMVHQKMNQEEPEDNAVKALVSMKDQFQSSPQKRQPETKKEGKFASFHENENSSIVYDAFEAKSIPLGANEKSKRKEDKEQIKERVEGQKQEEEEKEIGKKGKEEEEEEKEKEEREDRKGTSASRLKYEQDTKHPQSKSNDWNKKKLKGKSKVKSNTIKPNSSSSQKARGAVKVAGGPCFACQETMSCYWRNLYHHRVCNACGVRFQKNGKICLKCYYIPDKKQASDMPCPRCDEPFSNLYSWQQL